MVHLSWVSLLLHPTHQPVVQHLTPTTGREGNPAAGAWMAPAWGWPVGKNIRGGGIPKNLLLKKSIKKYLKFLNFRPIHWPELKPRP